MTLQRTELENKIWTLVKAIPHDSSNPADYVDPFVKLIDSHVEPLQKELKHQLQLNDQYFNDAKELLSERDKLKSENENLVSVMIAAAEEIQEHWQAHCDEEGYGPQNLMLRLERGIPANYPGYKFGAFTKMQSEIDSLKEQLKQYTEPNLNVKTE